MKCSQQGTNAASVETEQVLHDIGYAMRRLSVSRETVERLMDSGELAFVDVAPPRGRMTRRMPRFTAADVDAFIAKRRRAAAAVPDEPATEVATSAEGSRCESMAAIGARCERRAGHRGNHEVTTPVEKRPVPEWAQRYAGAERYR